MRFEVAVFNRDFVTLYPPISSRFTFGGGYMPKASFVRVGFQPLIVNIFSISIFEIRKIRAGSPKKLVNSYFMDLIKKTIIFGRYIVYFFLSDSNDFLMHDVVELD